MTSRIGRHSQLRDRRRCFNQFVAVPRTTADDAAQFRCGRGRTKIRCTIFDARRDSSVDAAQVRLTRALKRRIEAIDRSCGLNASQTKKLELAGRRAIKRLFDSIAERKQVFLSEGRDRVAAMQYLSENPEILALRKQLRDGPFDEESLFAKTVAKTLTPEQAARYAKRSALAAGSNRKITRPTPVILSESPKSRRTFIGSRGIATGSMSAVWHIGKTSTSTCHWQTSPFVPSGRERSSRIRFWPRRRPSRHHGFRWQGDSPQLSRRQETRNPMGRETI